MRWHRGIDTPHQSPAVTASPQGEAFVALWWNVCYNTTNMKRNITAADHQVGGWFYLFDKLGIQLCISECSLQPTTSVTVN